MKLSHVFLSALFAILIICIHPQLTEVFAVDTALKTPDAYTTETDTPSEVEALLSLSQEQLSQRNFEAAIATVSEAISIVPDDSALYSRRGSIYLQSQDYTNAIEDYSQSIKLDPNSPYTYSDRGLAYKLSQDYRSALEDFDQAIRLKPENTYFYSHRGEIRQRFLNDSQGAVEDYTRAIILDSDKSHFYTNRGKARIDLGDRQRAIEDYAQAVRLEGQKIEFQSTKIGAFRTWYAIPMVSVVLCFLWVLSISLHEFGHAIVAYWGGDKSVKSKGYLTLNPVKYIHPLTSILIPGFFFLMGGFPLPGAAVYVDHQNLRNRRWRSATFAAGPLASLLVTLLLIVFFHIISASALPYWVSAALAFFISLHFFLTLTNLLPIPPLDGYGILEPWLPKRVQVQLRKVSFLSLIGLLILCWLFPVLTLPLGDSVFTLTDRFGISEQLVWDGFDLFNRWYGALAIGIIGLLALILQRQVGWQLLGALLSHSKRYEQAVVAYGKALAIKHDNHWTWEMQGYVFNKLERYEEAIAAYDQAIALNPNNEWIWLIQGSLLERLERYDEAIAVYTKSIECNSAYSWTWARIGFLLKKLEHYEEAVFVYDKVITLNPNDDQAWGERGWVLERLERYDEAVAAYDQAIGLNPNDDWDWRRRGRALEKLERYDEALNSFDKAIELKSDNDWTWRQRGWTLEKLERYPEALAAYDKALELKPNDAWTQRRRKRLVAHIQPFELSHPE